MKIKLSHFNIRYIIGVCVVFLSPFVATYLLVAFTGNNLFEAAPIWTYGDEAFYYYQIGGAVEYNAPLGYFGYDGTHAELGTFGPWGIGLLVPYIIFGKIFGWTLNAPILANLLFLCIANFIFVITTKCKLENLKYVIVVNFLLYFNIIYSVSGFCESAKYCTAIILIGFLYKLAYLKTSKIFRYCVVPLFILATTTMYTPMIAFFVLYGMIIMDFIPKVRRFFLSVGASIIIVVPVMSICGLFTSPFTAYNSSMKSIATALKEDGIFQAIKIGGSLFFDNIQMFIPTGALEQIAFEKIYFWFYTVIWILIAWMLYVFLEKKTCVQDKQILMASIYILLAFIMALSFLYGSGYPQTTRAINVALCSVVFAGILQKSRKTIIMFLLLCVLGLPIFFNSLSSWMNQPERFLSKQEVQMLEEDKKKVQEVIKIQPSNDPWENTVAYCRGNGGDPALMYLPMGVGINLLATNPINENAKYVIIGQYAEEERVEESKQLLVENEHKILLETDEVTVLLNNRFAK